MRAKITNSLLKSLVATGNGFDVNDTELPGFALRVSAEGGPTSYSVRYRSASGRRKRLKVGSAKVLTPAQARELAQQALADVTKGNDPQETKMGLRSAQTLGDYIAKEYAPYELAHKKSGKKTLKTLERHFSELWNWSLKDKSYANAILAWRAKRLSEGIKPATCNRDIKTLRAVFSHAVRQGTLEEHPLAKVRSIKTDSQGVIRYLTDEEMGRLLQALDEREAGIRKGLERGDSWYARHGRDLPDPAKGSFADHIKPMVLVSLHTGLRRGELFSLEWRDINLDRAMLTVRGENAKNGKSRHTPLNSVALAVLKEWKVQTSGTCLLFKSPRSGTRFNNVHAAWSNLLEAAEVQNFRWHDMRHTFASRLVMVGVDLNTVRELLGHGDIKETLRYAHLAPEHKAAAVERLV